MLSKGGSGHLSATATSTPQPKHCVMNSPVLNSRTNSNHEVAPSKIVRAAQAPHAYLKLAMTSFSLSHLLVFMSLLVALARVVMLAARASEGVARPRLVSFMAARVLWGE